MSRLAGMCTSLCSSWLLIGCYGHLPELTEAKNAYEQARYEVALVWLGEVESRRYELSFKEKGRFFYYRGMAAYRLGRIEEAKYYLSIASQLVKTKPRASPLSARSRIILDKTLADLRYGIEDADQDALILSGVE